jgi:hypothetical protein
MEAIGQSLVELSAKVESMTQKKREPMNAVGYAATEARYEAARKRKEQELQEKSN